MMLYDLITYLKGQLPLSQVVGTRIYPVVRTTDDLPAITVRRAGVSHAHQVSGGAGYANASVEINSIAETYKGAYDLGELVRAEMQGLGNINQTWGEGTQFMSITLGSEQDGYANPPEGAGTGTFFVQQDYTVLFVESIPAPT